MDYQNMTDEQLVALSQTKDAVATNLIFARYKNFVRGIIRKKDLFLPDGDAEDLLQEGMMGLFNAVNTYVYSPSTQFISYAYVCVERMLISAIEKSNCGKNRALNNSVSLENEMGENGEVNSTVDLNPETKYINRESVQEFFGNMKDVLSPLEDNILHLYLDGYSYEEIGKKTDKNVKAIDNALQRIRAKIKTTVKKDGEAQ